LLSREPPPRQSFEARFYLGYARFRTYRESELKEALVEYGKLQADLNSRLQDEFPADEKKRALGLLIETYAQMASANAQLLYLLRKPDCDPNQSAADKHQAKEYFDNTTKYAGEAEKLTKSADDISPDILEDVAWRQLNALGYAEFCFACFDSASEYKNHCDKALKYFDQALQRSPLNFNILENQAEVYRDALYAGRNLDEAEKLFLQSTDLKPDDLYAPQQLGMIYEGRWKDPANSNDKEKTTEYYQKMVEYYQKATELHSSSAAYKLAMMYETLWNKSHKPDDQKNMIAYYQKAAQLGSLRAKARLEALHLPVKAKA